MGSATTQALAASTSALAEATNVTLDTAAELFNAARVLSGSSQLSGALADSAAPAQARTAVVAAVFGSTSAVTQKALSTAAAQRWSSAADLIDGVEELAIRAASMAAPDADIEGELFGFAQVVAANPDLELALGSRLGDEEAKGALVRKLFSDKASPAATLVFASLVSNARERRVRQLLARAGRIVSAQRDRVVATVRTAKALTEGQRNRLTELLTARYGVQVALNEVHDPAVIGGLRVQVADDVIDGSISSRLADLRQRLAG